MSHIRVDHATFNSINTKFKSVLPGGTNHNSRSLESIILFFGYLINDFLCNRHALQITNSLFKDGMCFYMKKGKDINGYPVVVLQRTGQIISFELSDEIDLTTPVGEVFKRGDIQIVFGRLDMDKRAAKMVVMARNFRVVCHEVKS